MKVHSSDFDPERLRRLLADEVARDQARGILRYFLVRVGVIAAVIWMTAPKILGAFGRLISALGSRPTMAFAAFVVVSVVSYLPMHLWLGDGRSRLVQREAFTGNGSRSVRDPPSRMSSRRGSAPSRSSRSHSSPAAEYMTRVPSPAACRA